jgi:hypothetical protein
MDDFYEPLSNATSRGAASGLISSILETIVAAPLAVIVSIVLIPILVVISTRLLSGSTSEGIAGRDGKNVSMLPYWVPVIGHGFQL